METISNRLKDAIKYLNITQSELAKRTGINKGALSSYISGRYEPKQKAIYELAKALNVDEAWLIGYDVPMERKNHTPSSDEFILTDHERDHIEMYRDLDNIGQHTVDAITKVEFERVKKEKK